MSRSAGKRCVRFWTYLPGLAKEPLTYQRRPQSESDSSWRWTNPGPLQRDEIWILKSKTLRHCNANEIMTQRLSGNRGTAAFLLNRENPGLRVHNIVPPEALTVNFTDKELVKVQSGSGLLPQVGTWAHPKVAIFYARWADREAPQEREGRHSQDAHRAGIPTG